SALLVEEGRTRQCRGRVVLRRVNPTTPALPFPEGKHVVLPLPIVEIVDVLVDVSAQSSPRSREDLHALHMPAAGSGVGIAVRLFSAKPHANVVGGDLVMRNARIAAEVQITLHGESPGIVEHCEPGPEPALRWSDPSRSTGPALIGTPEIVPS